MPRPDAARLYRTANAAVLGLMLYGLALPFVFPALGDYLPAGALTCPLLRWTGLPCPMCGLTRGLRHLLTGSHTRAAALSPLSVFTLVFAVSEIAYRTWALIARPGGRLAIRLIRSDVFLHTVLVAGYFIYTGAFFLMYRQ